jgi:hypothetical protein
MYFWILLVPINILQQVLEPRMFPARIPAP